MDIETLHKLEKLNQVCLADAQEKEILEFFDERFAEAATLVSIDTEKTERIVHVMPMTNVFRDDTVVEGFDRETLQADAPETMDGYWQVPRTVN